MSDLLVVVGFAVGFMGIGAVLTLLALWTAFCAFGMYQSKEPPHDA